MRELRTTLLIGAAVGLTFLSGIVHGRFTNRWGRSEAMSSAAALLEQFPESFDGWKMVSSERMTPTVVEVLDCAGYFLRTYVNQDTGESVKVALMLGPAGTIAVHTPEICYSRQDYDIEEERQVVEWKDPNGASDAVWALTFRSNDAKSDLLRVYYGWSSGREWSAPKDPRFAFAGQPWLYKIQIAGHAPPVKDQEMDDSCRRFLQDFIPVARHYLRSGADERE